MEKLELLTVRETAALLKIAEGTIYNKISRNSQDPFPIKPRRFGKKLIRFNRKDVYDYMEEQ